MINVTVPKRFLNSFKLILVLENERPAIIEITCITRNNLNTVVTSEKQSNMQLVWTINKSANSATLEVRCIFWNNTLLNESIYFTNDKVKYLEYCPTNFSVE